MLEAIEKKRDELVKVMQQFNNCKIMQDRGNLLLISSHKPVPWKDALKKQYGESLYKIS